MGLNVSSETREQIRRIVFIPWKSIVKYLGLKLVAPLDKTAIIDLNIIPLIKDVQ